jgi:hypothetical protein
VPQVAWKYADNNAAVTEDDASSTQVRDGIAQLRRQQQRAVKWMLDRIGDDGEPVGAKDFNSYYRVPWAMAVCGEREAAASVLSWIERHALDEDGDARGAAQKPYLTRGASYSLTQIAIGAWHLERYDTAKRTMDTLQKHYQDPVTGGGYVERPEHRKTGKQDVLVSAQLGLAGLTTGRLEIAEGVYKWFVNLMRNQPELPRRMFTSWDSQGLVIEYEDDTAWGTVTDFHKTKQAFYNPGIASAFLGRYAMMSGDKVALSLAEQIIDLSVKGDELQWTDGNAQICKFGWGAAVLLEITQQRRYLEYILRMAPWYEEKQEADGRWHASPFLVPNPTDADDLPKTAEHALHVTTMLTALAGYRRRSDRFPAGPRATAAGPS